MLEFKSTTMPADSRHMYPISNTPNWVVDSRHNRYAYLTAWVLEALEVQAEHLWEAPD